MQPFSRPKNTSPMRLIVHADDCGLTPAVSADIFACLAQGPLNSVSVIMGGSHATESLRRLAALPYTRVCLHLNLLEGRCSAPIPQVRPLVTADGVFRHSLGQLLIALACAVGSRKKALLCAIRTEFEAQIDAFTTAFPQWRQRGGLHLDGHLHVHTIPALATTMRGLLHERAPAYVRLPREPAHLPPLPAAQLLTGCARRALLVVGPLRLPAGSGRHCAQRLSLRPGFRRQPYRHARGKSPRGHPPSKPDLPAGGNHVSSRRPEG